MQESHLSSHQCLASVQAGTEADNRRRLCYTYGLITSNSSDRCSNGSKLICELITGGKIILPLQYLANIDTLCMLGGESTDQIIKNKPKQKISQLVKGLLLQHSYFLLHLM